MTLKQFREAWDIARDKSIDLSQETIEPFWGFGLLDFNPTSCTIRQIACLIRWQCAYFDSTWDMEAADEIRRLGKKNFVVIG